MFLEDYTLLLLACRRRSFSSCFAFCSVCSKSDPKHKAHLWLTSTCTSSTPSSCIFNTNSFATWIFLQCAINCEFSVLVPESQFHSRNLCAWELVMYDVRSTLDFPSVRRRCPVSLGRLRPITPANNHCSPVSSMHTGLRRKIFR
jgi:hypothetical protein